ncbi:T9SS type A sorting domain-containing protein [Ochrovirga pacifica]|uniref:T9SS type A sorting domain-containing protein n=1 Tax=Ochrovirga pacifica TaxID=1042376 RepID=UPI0002558731|nr:T9SS type A sorting domain-containing protein [Ochrovirga pacifica]
MKKITLFIAFLLTTLFVNAQTTISITDINGSTVADYFTANPNLDSGTVLNITVEYKDVVAGTDNLVIRLLNNWAEIAGTKQTQTVASSTTAATTTFSITIPSINPGIDPARIQVRASKIGGGFQNHAPATFAINADESVEVSAEATISTINSVSPSNYHTSIGGSGASTNGVITEGTTLSFGVNFTALKKDPARDNLDLRVRFLTNGYATIPEIPEGTTTVTNSATEQSTTVSLTIPDISESIIGARIQVVAYGYNGSEDATIFSYVSPELFDIDATTLSTSKLVLEGVTVNANSISFNTEHANDSYTIYNIIGQSIKAGKVESQVNIADLANGVYILTTDKGSLKFVK